MDLPQNCPVSNSVNISLHEFISSLSAAFSALILLESCASATIIQSNPTGAKLYLNSAYAGTTPYTHTDTKIVSTTTFVRL